MIYSYYLISKKKLPKQFKYPKSFLYYLRYNETQEETSEEECEKERVLIREIEESNDRLSFFYQRLKYDFPEKNFVPFARLYDDLVYCFDGNDSSGNPGIFIVKTFTNQWGIDNQSFTIYYKNFYEWLKMSLSNGVEGCAHDVVFPCKDIPSTFVYPQEYLNIVKIYDIYKINKLYNSRFFFINCVCDEDRESFFNLLKKHNNLIPFMGRFNNEGITNIGCFFDEKDITGNSVVYIFDLLSTDMIVTYPNFKTFWNKILILEETLENQGKLRLNNEK